MKPKIGIVLCERENQKQSVSDAYIQAIHRSGGLPFILPLVKSSNSIAAYTAFCDGFLFCGGNDITLCCSDRSREKGSERRISHWICSRFVS